MHVCTHAGNAALLDAAEQPPESRQENEQDVDGMFSAFGLECKGHSLAGSTGVPAHRQSRWSPVHVWQMSHG